MQVNVDVTTRLVFSQFPWRDRLKLIWSVLRGETVTFPASRFSCDLVTPEDEGAPEIPAKAPQAAQEATAEAPPALPPSSLTATVPEANTEVWKEREPAQPAQKLPWAPACHYCGRPDHVTIADENGPVFYCITCQKTWRT